MKRYAYDKWLHWYVCERCCLDCEYCFDAARPQGERAPISPINIPGLMSTLDSTGSTFRISFAGGGEPFMVPNLTDACLEISKKHYLSFNTNLIENSVRNFLQSINPDKVIKIHASCHIRELEKLGLLDRYIQNFQLALDRGINISAQQVAYPPLKEQAQHYREKFAAYGIDLSFCPFVGTYNGQSYPQTYTEEEITLFDLARSRFASFRPNQRKHPLLCNAGFNTAFVLPDGKVISCFELNECIGNIYTGINFKPNLARCPAEFCGCPLYSYDAGLYQEAQRKNRFQVHKVNFQHRISLLMRKIKG